MQTGKMKISEQDSKKRRMILEGNLWLVLLYVGAPLALFQSLNIVFKLLDSMMAAHISPMSVSAVAYLSQINMMLSAIGGGLAIGASIKISEAYGEGNYEMVQRRVSSLLFLCVCLGGLTLFLLPFTRQFLQFTGTPEAFIEEGVRYFAVSLIDIALTLINTAYVAIERARGNAGRILWLNLSAIAVKLSLTAWFVYGLNGDVTSIAIATVVSDFVLLGACVWNLFIRGKGQVFGFDIRSITLNRSVTLPMVNISIPVMVERATFQLGKVVINGMATSYGELTVGALGISNNLGGITTNPQNGFQDAGASVISQNCGAGNKRRALSAFYRLCVINCTIGAIGYLLTMLLIQPLTHLFAQNDEAFAQVIAAVYRYEAIALVPLGLFSAVMALLYGFGYTKLTLVVNFSRVFVFRIPVLWALQQFTTLGSESVGIVMMVSNISTGVLALILGIAVIIHIRKTLPKEDRVCLR